MKVEETKQGQFPSLAQSQALTVAFWLKVGLIQQDPSCCTNRQQVPLTSNWGSRPPDSPLWGSVCVCAHQQSKTPGWVPWREVLPALMAPSLSAVAFPAPAVVAAGAVFGGTAWASALPWSYCILKFAGPGNCSREEANADHYETN